MTIYILLLFILIGFWLSVRLLPDVPFIFQLSLATVIGFLIGSWISWLVALLLGYKFVVAILTALVVFIYLKKPPKISLSFKLDKVWLIYTFITVAIFYFLFMATQLRVGSSGWYSVGPSWGDIPMHSSLITYFAAQDKFNFDYPLLVGTKLSYPFMIDFFSALLYRSGASIQNALIWPTYILILAFCQLLYCLILSVYKSRLRAVLSPMIFFLNGSFLASYYFIKDMKASNSGIFSFINSMTIDYTQIESRGLALMNIVVSHILPQRGIVFGLAVVAVLLMMLNKSLQEKDIKRYLFPAAILIGLLPFIHIHSFLIAIYFSIIVIYVLFSQKKLAVRELIWPTLIALLISAPQLIWQMLNNPPSSFLVWRLGWLNASNQNILMFWLNNLGLVASLVLAMLLKNKDWPRNIFSYLFIPSVMIFFVINILKFQPNDFDNYKFYIFAWLIFSVLIGDLLAGMFKGGLLRRILAGLIFLMLIFPGVLSLIRTLTMTNLLISNNDINFAKKVQEIVPQNQTILTTSAHNNPISMLSGRKVVMGYPGWLVSYGKDISELDWIEINSLDVEKADQYIKNTGVKYVAVENLSNQAELETRGYKELTLSGDWKLYGL